jgi:hypothetical protein
MLKKLREKRRDSRGRIIIENAFLYKSLMIMAGALDLIVMSALAAVFLYLMLMATAYCSS